MSWDVAASWRELDAAIAETGGSTSDRHVHSTLVFRGLARAAYANTSSLARLSHEHPQLERHLIRNFRKYAHREAPGPTTWDWLSLAQLGERAADLAALDALTRAGGDGGPFALFFEPPSLDERIVNQAAVLSVISDARCQMDAWLEAHPGLWRAWRIPPEVKAEARERLDQANVTERILLPGLDGLAAWLRRYYAPRRIPLGSAGAAAGAMSEDGRDPQAEGAMS